MKYIYEFFKFFLSFVVGLVSGILTARVSFRKDYNNSTDLELVKSILLKLSTIFIVFIFWKIVLNKKFKTFPFIFAILTTQDYIGMNIKYLQRKYIWKDENPKVLHRYGK